MRLNGQCDIIRDFVGKIADTATGHWTKDEEDELTQIVTEMAIHQGRDFDNDVFWGKVYNIWGIHVEDTSVGLSGKHLMTSISTTEVLHHLGPIH